MSYNKPLIFCTYNLHWYLLLSHFILTELQRLHLIWEFCNQLSVKAPTCEPTHAIQGEATQTKPYALSILRLRLSIYPLWVYLLQPSLLATRTWQSTIPISHTPPLLMLTLSE